MESIGWSWIDHGLIMDWSNVNRSVSTCFDLEKSKVLDRGNCSSWWKRCSSHSHHSWPWPVHVSGHWMFLQKLKDKKIQKGQGLCSLHLVTSLDSWHFILGISLDLQLFWWPVGRKEKVAVLKLLCCAMQCLSQVVLHDGSFRSSSMLLPGKTAQISTESHCYVASDLIVTKNELRIFHQVALSSTLHF